MSSGREVPREANWVQSSFDCQIKNVWSALTKQIHTDVSEWRRLAVENDGTNLEVDFQNDGSLSVVKSGYMKRVWVRVDRKEQSIAVHRSHQDGLPAELHPKLSDEDGECYLHDGERELRMWQVSRLILEPVFTWKEF